MSELYDFEELIEYAPEVEDANILGGNYLDQLTEYSRNQLEQHRDDDDVLSFDEHCEELVQLATDFANDTSNGRLLNSANWMNNRRKYKRNSGLEYVGVSGKQVPAKEFTNKPCNCRWQCHNKFKECERKLLFDTFWDLQDYSLQNISLHGMVRVIDAVQQGGGSGMRPRLKTFHYYLQPNVEADALRVCKRFFLETFQISHGRMYRCCSKLQLEAAADNRGGNLADGHKEFRRLQRLHVREHIEQFALYKEQFLSSTLTIRKMYELYVQECATAQQMPLSEKYYYQVMDNFFSVKLHKDKQQQLKLHRRKTLRRREKLLRLLRSMLQRNLV